MEAAFFSLFGLGSLCILLGLIYPDSLWDMVYAATWFYLPAVYFFIGMIVKFFYRRSEKKWFKEQVKRERESIEAEKRKSEQEEREIRRLLNHKTFPHLLVYAPPGFGKTTLIRIIINHLQEAYGHTINFYELTPSSIKSKRDLDGIFLNLKDHDVIFMDEIHSLPLPLAEAMYSAVQDYKYSFSAREEVNMNGMYFGQEMGQGGMIELPKFTLMAGTTERGMIPEPAEDRFKIVLELQPYTIEELAELVAGYVERRTAPSRLNEYLGQSSTKRIIKMNLEAINPNLNVFVDGNIKSRSGIITDEGCVEIAKRSLRTPRLAIRLTDHVLTFTVSQNIQVIDQKVVDEASRMIPIDKNGLRLDHLRLIKALLGAHKYTLGRGAIASATRTSQNNIQNRLIPQLDFSGYLTRNNRQMAVLTEKALEEYSWLSEKEI
jgi:Holliday junction DNA helicase RuvB